MNGCSLDDAFQEMGGAPSPGCGSTLGTREARREERKKMRRNKDAGNRGHLPNGQDPDRLTVARLPDVNPMTGVQNSSDMADSFYASKPQQNAWLHSKNRHQCEAKQGSADCDNDPMDAYLKGEERGHIMVVPVSSTTTITKPNKFFGASGPDEDTFADYAPNQEDYRLQPDFGSAFDSSGAARAGATPTLPTPPINQFWKPITPSGAQTSFIEHLPPAVTSAATTAATTAKQLLRTQTGEEISVDELMRRLDTLYARLDDMNQGSPEQMTSEILMFISSGIFVMFMMDLLVRRR